MRIFLFFVLSLGIIYSSVISQTIIFSEDFESGSPSTDWELFFLGEDPLQAVAMTSAPAPLTGGGNYCGYLQDIDGSYTGVSIAVAGDVSLSNYTIEADVYCYVNHPNGSAYTGLVVYADSSHQGSTSDEFYYKFVADFDASNRFRLYNNQLDLNNPPTFYTFHHSIDATGLYSTDDWHHMKLEVTTLNDSTTQFLCYFDGNVVGTGFYEDTGVDQVGSGKFGLFAFQQDADGIAGYFDNIVVTQLGTSIDEKPIQSVSDKFILAQNYPNPFNPSTTIEFNLDKTDNVSLSIYNTAGKMIKNLTNDKYTAGTHKLVWDATDYSGKKVSAGVYLYSLQTSNGTETKKMILLK